MSTLHENTMPWKDQTGRRPRDQVAPTEFLNRELRLGWNSLNRVLHEAQDDRNPSAGPGKVSRDRLLKPR
jgi:hypothetical protein